MYIEGRNTMKQKKTIKLNTALVLLSLVPVVVTAIALAIVTSGITVNKLEGNVQEELRISARGLQEFYQYDLDNELDLVDGFLHYETDYVDTMGQDGVDYTIFKGNVRFVTNIKDKNGKRIEGTKASDAVWATCKAGQEYYSDSLVIEGVPYYGYYIPLKNSKGVLGMAFAGKPASDIKAAENAVIFSVISVGIAFIVVFAIIVILVARKIAVPMKKVSDGIVVLSGGDISGKIEISSIITETTRLIDASSKLNEVLADSIGKIRGCTNSIVESISSTNEQTRASADSISQINTSMDDLSQTTVTMAESVQDISSEIIEMGRMVETATSSADNLSNNAKAMNNANTEASNCIENVVKSSDKSSEAIAAIIDRIKATNMAVVKIDEMVKMITAIANQTNLLALNASIEAARAGEAGRGFAVVAEEIGQLAAQSNESARKIDSIVDEIGKLSKECVEESSTVKTLIDEEKDLLATTLDKFKALDSNIKASVNEITDIAEITKKLESVKNNVTEAISDLSAISQETSATNEEVSATIEAVSANMRQLSSDSDRMSDVAGELANAVKYFK